MNLLDAYPNIANEWHPRLNAKSPCDVTAHSHQHAWWVCNCGHEWKAVINNRTSNGTTCYDGIFWHKDKIAQDTKKYDLARKHKIFLVRISEIPEVPADRVFNAKKVTHALLKEIISCIQTKDIKEVFKSEISSYLETKKYQNSDLFKTNYVAVRKHKCV